MPNWLLIATPGDERVAAFQGALVRCGERPAEMVPWTALAADPEVLAQRLQPGSIVRIESPGGDAAAWRAIAGRGGWHGPAPAPGDWRPGRQWAAGLAAVLREVEEVLARADVRTSHDCRDILAMTDKAACRERLAAAGVPIPAGSSEIHDVDALRRFMCERRWAQVFIKPRWGSSGAGVMAVRRRSWSEGSEEAVTTTLRSGNNARWSNAKQQRTSRDPEEISRLLTHILADGAVVERWVPKAARRGGPLDLRLLMIDGAIRHRLARIGSGPITNLHLDAERADADDVIATLPSGTWGRISDCCLRAATAFPRSRMIGLDCLVTDGGQALILEANAWGDLLRRARHDGEDPHEAQVRSLLAGSAAVGS